MNSFKYALVLIFGSFALVGCGSDTDDSSTDFDRSTFLSDQLNEIVIPGYQLLDTQLDSLNQMLSSFLQNPNNADLVRVQDAWLTAYKSYQMVNAFNFGPAAEDGLLKSLQEEIATFPVSLSKVDEILSTGNYNVSDFNRDARGFLTLERMLFGHQQTVDEVVQAFQDQTYQQFTNDVLQDIRNRVNEVSTNWNSEEIASFISNNGTDAGSSTSSLYNEYVKGFEALKNFKVALPLGLRAGQTQAEPTLVEARFSGSSIDLLKADFESVKTIWYGKEDHMGFEEYLVSVTGGEALAESTKAQFAQIDDILNNISNDEDLAQLIDSNDTRLISLNTELQKLTRFLKSDLSSLLGISITYASGDGD